MAPAGLDHGDVAAQILISIGAHVRKLRLGKVYAAETGFYIDRDPDTVRAPDVAFIRADRLDQIDPDTAFGDIAPDLVAEVISPSDSYSAVTEKTNMWIDAGVRPVILVDPQNKSAQLIQSREKRVALNTDDTLHGADVLPDWSLPLSELFGR